VDDWARLHNSGGDGGSSIIGTSLCKFLQSLLAQDFFVEKDLFYPVLDNPDGRIQLL
jgi:hypothetical protein